MVRRLLLLLLLPVVVFVQAAPAQAVETYGPAVSYSFVKDEGPLSDIRCSGKAAWVVEADAGATVASIDVSMRCDWDLHFYPDTESVDEAYTEWYLVGNRPDGNVDGCDFLATSSGDPFAGTISGSTNLGNAECMIDELCIAADYKNWLPMFDAEVSLDLCVSLPLGSPPEPSSGPAGSCVKGMPGGAGFEYLDGDNFSGWSGYHGHRFKIRMLADPEAVKTGSSTTGWSWRLVHSGGGAVSEHHTNSDGLNGDPGWVGNNYTGPKIGSGNLHSGDPGPGAHGEVGVQIYFRGYGMGSQVQNGYTDPNQCVFWFGPKIIDRPGDTLDEPFGPANSDTDVGGSTPPPDMTPDPIDPDADGNCTFDINDPTTWLEGGMCAAVGLLGGIYDLLSGFVGGILDGLLALFVPDSADMESKMGSVKSDWENSGPGEFVTTFGDVVDDLTIPAPSGCQGPPVTVTSPIDGRSVTIYPLSACPAEVQTLATVIKSALTVVIYVGAFMAAFHIVLSGFGLYIFYREVTPNHDR